MSRWAEVPDAELNARLAARVRREWTAVLARLCRLWQAMNAGEDADDEGLW